MKLSDQLLQKIKENQFRPIPRWYFFTKNVVFWGFFIVATILGALAFSVILFAVQQTDFQLLSHLSHSPIELVLGILPLIWLVSLVVFLVLSMYSIQYSKRGYKLSFLRLVGYSTALSFVVGTLFFISGGGEALESAFAIRIAQYESIQEKKVELWSKPNEGFLSGEIIEANGEAFQLLDFKGVEWQVLIQEAFIPQMVLIERGERVKLLGQMKGENQFKASEIRPWGGPGRPKDKNPSGRKRQ